VKRGAEAVEEESIVVQVVHQYFASLREAPPVAATNFCVRKGQHRSCVAA
jgi:hypothetical protein